MFCCTPLDQIKAMLHRIVLACLGIRPSAGRSELTFLTRVANIFSLLRRLCTFYNIGHRLARLEVALLLMGSFATHPSLDKI